MRQQHYRFAHQVLMNAVLRDPFAWFSNAATHGTAMLRDAWNAAGEGLGPQDCADGSSLALMPVSPAPGIDAIVITLPAPIAPTECYFIAIVRVGNNGPRYFVAERGMDGDNGILRAYWAEWKQTPGGGIMRIRGADLPAITPEAFVSAAITEASGTPQNAPGQAPPGAAPWPGPQGGNPWPPANKPPEKKNNRALMFAGCGCLSLLLFVFGTGGFILYQEELRGIHIPDTEVTSVVVEPDKPFKVQFTWDGTGYAFNNIWLVVEEGKTSGGSFAVKGSLGCGRARGSRPQEVNATLPGYAAKDVVRKGGDAFSGWLYLGDEYDRSSSRPIECEGIIKPVTGSWTKGRIVVTQRQRPSDWIAR